jgi:hypothetical protein
MALMLGKLYGALRDAGATEASAREAAEEAASYENRIASVESLLRLHTWILSANTAGIAIILGKLFVH